MEHFLLCDKCPLSYLLTYLHNNIKEYTRSALVATTRHILTFQLQQQHTHTHTRRQTDRQTEREREY